MKTIKTFSDVGGVLVGTKDFGVVLHNGIGDGETTCVILDKAEGGELPKNAIYNTGIDGMFNIYESDTSLRRDEDIVMTLTGEYFVYYLDYNVYFVKF